MRANEKASTGAIREASESNNLISFGGNQKGFDVSDYAPKPEKIQCQKCNPPLVNPRGGVRLCADCWTENEQTAKTLFDNFRRHRRVHRLDRRCYGCESQKTSGMMSKIFPDICRRCADELKAKGATAQNNFISRATNNFFKNLKRAVMI